MAAVSYPNSPGIKITERSIRLPSPAARAWHLVIKAGVALGVLLLHTTAVYAQTQAHSSEMVPARFIGRTVAESDPPAWPANPAAPKGAPNVLLVMTDDVGFGASSVFGGPVPTPAFEALARQGLRYNQFNTAGICSPTRAALLTGRSPHNVGVGDVINSPAGYDGYYSVIPRSAATVAEVLKQAGYSTAMFGKWHLVPLWEQSQAGPFDRWPTGMGFEYFYGFLDADTSEWEPSLVINTTPTEPPHDNPNFHLDRAMADEAIQWIRRHSSIAPDKPFFVYYAPGTSHAPHHAPKEWIEKFQGKFDQGWDKLREEIFARQQALGVIPANTVLTPRPALLPSWNSLSDDQKRLNTRLMQAYAAALAFADHQIARIIEYLRQSGQLENTLVIYIQGDNGASAEGGLRGNLFEQSYINRTPESMDYQLSRLDEIGGANLYNQYSAGWAWAMDTPFQYYKQIASHFGGIRNGLVISWPARIKEQGLRQQFHYITDIAPTILEAVGIAFPSVVNGTVQKPVDGISMSYTFVQPNGPSRRKRQIFEVNQNAGIYYNGWFANTVPVQGPWEFSKPVSGGQPSATPLDQKRWELYHVASDFSQARDLAKSNPKQLERMQQLFWAEAGRGHLLPFHDRGDGIEGRPSLAAGRDSFTFYPGLTRLPQDAAPHILGRAFEIIADVTLNDDSTQGVIVTQGGKFSGYAFYMKEGHLVFHYNAVGEHQYGVRTAAPVSQGRHALKAAFHPDTPNRGSDGMLTLYVDGAEVASGRIDHTLFNWISHTEGLDVGEDTITPINDDYTIGSSRFTGTLHEVTFHLLDGTPRKAVRGP